MNKSIRTLFAIVLSLSWWVPAEANEYQIETKIPAPANTNDLHFGLSLGISGDTAIVGTRRESAHSSSFYGEAYLINLITNQQIAKLSNPTISGSTAIANGFATAVAIDGAKAIVGAPSDRGVTFSTGAAYIFDATSGSKLLKLSASDGLGGDGFGRAVSISGETAIVGAISYPDGGYGGAAYIFTANTGNQLFKLAPSDPDYQDYFGSSVAVEGNFALVGAPGASSGGVDIGAAYLFDVSSGLQLTKLIASDAAVGDQFGYSVAISGNLAIVGAPHNDDGGSSSGAAYLFDLTTGTELFKFTATDEEALAQFGNSVDISGLTAIVGAPFSSGESMRSGGAYLFDLATGDELAKLAASDGDTEDRFGWSVGLSSEEALVGAYLDGLTNTGSVYSYEASVPEPSSFVLTICFSASLLFSCRQHSKRLART